MTCFSKSKPSSLDGAVKCLQEVNELPPPLTGDGGRGGYEDTTNKSNQFDGWIDFIGVAGGSFRVSPSLSLFPSFDFDDSWHISCCCRLLRPRPASLASVHWYFDRFFHVFFCWNFCQLWVDFDAVVSPATTKLLTRATFFYDSLTHNLVLSFAVLIYANTRVICFCLGEGRGGRQGEGRAIHIWYLWTIYGQLRYVCLRLVPSPSLSSRFHVVSVPFRCRFVPCNSPVIFAAINDVGAFIPALAVVPSGGWLLAPSLMIAL